MSLYRYRLQHLFVLVFTACSTSFGKAHAKEYHAQCKHDFFPVKVSLLQSSSSFSNNELIQIAESSHKHVGKVAQQLEQSPTVKDLPTPIKELPAPLVDLYKTGDDMIDTLFSLALCVLLSGAHLVFFACVRVRYSNIYSNNIEIGVVEDLEGDGFFAWISSSMSMSLEDIVEVGGLDVAMFLKSLELCGNVLMTIGIPMTVILCPLHFNGSIGMIDPMDQIGIGNLETGSRVFWLHAFVVWAVVYIVQRQIRSAQREFRDLRLQWLEELPRPRCTTVLVRGIPEDIATDIELKKFVESLFNEDSVEAAFVVRWVPDHFGEAVKKRDDCMEELLKSKHSQSKAQAEESKRISQDGDSRGGKRRSVTYMGSAAEDSQRDEARRLSFNCSPSELGSQYGRKRPQALDEHVISSEGMPSKGHSEGMLRVPSKGHSEGMLRVPSKGHSEGMLRVPSKGQSEGMGRAPSAGQRRISAMTASTTLEAKKQALYASEGSIRCQSKDKYDGASSQSDDEHHAKSVLELHEAQEALKKAQKELDDLQDGLRDVKYGFAHDGFVTFKRRRDAEFAVSMRISFQPDELLFYEAPDPTDVRYEVFLRQGFEPTGMAILGYLSLFGIFASYTPTLFFVAKVSKVDYMRGIAFFDWLATNYQMLANLWDSQVTPTLLTVIPSCMPYPLMLIVKQCFSCPSERGCQVVLQEWYFRYLIIFLLFIFTISSSLTQTWMEIVKYPGKIFELLAKSLPNVMHFYMSYVPMQAVVAAANLGRYWVFITYLYYCQRFDEDYSRELSEPEDQDFNGMASRNARISLIFVIALVFSSICPPICILAYFTFLIHRVVFGYIMVYAETRKIDTGGVFWSCHVRHMQVGLLVFITTMVGIIYDKNKLASYAAGGSYALCAFMWLQLEKLLDCDRLPLEDIVRLDQHETRVEGDGTDSWQEQDAFDPFAHTYADASRLVLPTLYTQPHLHVRKAAKIMNKIATKLGASTNKAITERLPPNSERLANVSRRFTTHMTSLHGTPRSARSTGSPRKETPNATPRQGSRQGTKEELQAGSRESPQSNKSHELDSSCQRR